MFGTDVTHDCSRIIHGENKLHNDSQVAGNGIGKFLNRCTSHRDINNCEASELFIACYTLKLD